MASIMISDRLQTIASYCPEGAKVADIGSDHALLASYLVLNNIASSVVAGELNEGPYLAAKRQVESILATNRISVRRGDGLAVIHKNEVDVVCIAGMGGQLIASILEAGKEKLEGVSRLILQPNVGEDMVRKWLIANGWQLVHERILEEDGIIYEVLVADLGDPDLPYRNQSRSQSELMRLGPMLWQEKSPVLLKKLERERDKWHKIQTQISQSERAETQERLQEVQQEINWLNEVIQCLQMDKPSSNTSNN
ncbi:tRNA (adenine(22)-N(1))-methyltransferase [Brevibacillus ginsengisoli]|uniref:tRNA (adenine(22)-N(1))-methyltransferase n=1 Tax=Brevibacillus ginsengisoli TaxID=363854 RepID=UPI003CEB67F4